MPAAHPSQRRPTRWPCRTPGSIGSGTKKRTFTFSGGRRLTTIPPAGTHSPARLTVSSTSDATGAVTARWSSCQRAWASAAAAVSAAASAAATWSTRPGRRAVASSASAAATRARPSAASERAWSSRASADASERASCSCRRRFCSA
jgi:hypothetical protein